MDPDSSIGVRSNPDLRLELSRSISCSKRNNGIRSTHAADGILSSRCEDPQILRLAGDDYLRFFAAGSLLCTFGWLAGSTLSGTEVTESPPCGVAKIDSAPLM